MENMVTLPSAAFWTGKRVLVTGHTGFKGSWLCQWLTRMKAEVIGVALAPDKELNLFRLLQLEQTIESHISDLRDKQNTTEIIKRSRPDIIFHLAAQPLVRESYRSPVDTFSTNILGTVNVLEAARHTGSVKAVVVVTTDKVYNNQEWSHPYRESDRLGGSDPYSASKAACELIVKSYRDSFMKKIKVALTTVRAGNVFGGGDWSSDRLVPDIISNWSNGKAISIRYPNAVRPWQHVLEPLCGYLVVAERSFVNPEMHGAYNIGPDHSDQICVSSLIDIFKLAYGSGEYLSESFEEDMHEASILTLDNSLIKRTFGIRPRWSLEEAVQRTVVWHKKLAEGLSAQELCDVDIAAYEANNV